MIHKVVRRSLFFALSLYLFTLANAGPTDEEKEEFIETLDNAGTASLVLFILGFFCILCGSVGGIFLAFVWIIALFVIPMFVLLNSWSYGYDIFSTDLYPNDGTYRLRFYVGQITFWVLVATLAVFIISVIYALCDDIYNGDLKCTACSNKCGNYFNRFTNCFNRFTNCFNRCTNRNTGVILPPGQPPPPPGKPPQRPYRDKRFDFI